MKQFGAFLSNLRSSAGLSLEEVARLVESSKSTLSRLENDEIAQPFKGSMRQLVLTLAQLLCTSRSETERYLALAGIDRGLLTEREAIEAGFPPHVAAGASDEASTLQRLERVYTELLTHLEARE